MGGGRERGEEGEGRRGRSELKWEGEKDGRREGRMEG